MLPQHCRAEVMGRKSGGETGRRSPGTVARNVLRTPMSLGATRTESQIRCHMRPVCGMCRAARRRLWPALEKGRVSFSTFGVTAARLEPNGSMHALLGWVNLECRPGLMLQTKQAQST